MITNEEIKQNRLLRLGFVMHIKERRKKNEL